jgi:hypothetical protein
LAWTPPPRFTNTAHSAPSLSPSAAGIVYVAARIPPAGLVSHRDGAVHPTEPAEPPTAGPPDCSGLISLGAAAQAAKTANIEREIIETKLKIRALFKVVPLLIDFRTSRGDA